MKLFKDMEQDRKEEKERQRFCQLMDWYLEAHGRELLDRLGRKEPPEEEPKEQLNEQLAAQEALNQELEAQLAVLHGELNEEKALNQELNEQLQALHRDLQGQRAINQELSVQVKSQEKLNRDLEAQLQSQMTLNRRLADQLGQLEHFIKGYGLFRQVPDRLWGGLAEALGCHEDIESFICGAAQERHLDSLWKYISYAINSRQAGAREAALLDEIFRFAFELVSRGSRHPSYELVEVEAGTAFSPLSMARVDGSRQQGRVASQWLSGYCYKGSGKVVNPAMVMVE